MNTSTLDQLITQFNVDVDPHLERAMTVPVSDQLQRQGDVIVINHLILAPNERPDAATTPLEAAGFPVVRGESGGNTHLLLGAGDVYFDVRPADLQLGVVTVAEGATAYLAHPEHGYVGIAPGTYVIRRQREQADVARVVAD